MLFPLRKRSNEKLISLQSEATEKERALKELMENLALVDEATIMKWNVDKNIKEEAGGAPFLLIQPDELY